MDSVPPSKEPRLDFLDTTPSNVVMPPPQRNHGGRDDPSEVTLSTVFVPDEVEVVPYSPGVVESTLYTQQILRSRRRWKMTVIILLVLLGMGAIIAIVVSTTKHKSSDKDNNTSTNNTSSQRKVLITVVLQLDDKPEETGWLLACQSQDSILNIPSGFYTEPNEEVRILARVVQNEICTITLTDTGGNGINDGFLKVYYGALNGTNRKLQAITQEPILILSGNFETEARGIFTVVNDVPNTETTIAPGDDSTLSPTPVPTIAPETPTASPTTLRGTLSPSNFGSTTLPSTEIPDDATTLPVFTMSPTLPSTSTTTTTTRTPPPSSNNSPSPNNSPIPATTSPTTPSPTTNGSTPGSTSTPTPPVPTEGPATRTPTMRPTRTPNPTPSPTPDPETQMPTPNPTNSPITPNPTVGQEEVSPLNKVARFVGDHVGDRFGDDVHFSRNGRRIAVGANNRNYVRVYEWNGDSFQKIGTTIRHADGGSFGSHLNLNQDGSILVVGAWGSDGGNLAKIFKFDSGSWNQMGQTLRGDDIHESFGWDVALSDDGFTVVVSARLGDDPDNNVQEEGYVRVYDYRENNNNWVQRGKDIVGIYSNGGFGRSVDISANGNRIAIGANKAGPNGEGQVIVFDWNDASGWIQVGQAMNGEELNDYQGTSVSLSADGSSLVTSADGNDRNGDYAGLVRTYQLVANNEWKQYGQDILGECCGDFLGVGHISMSSNGRMFAVGAQANGSGDRGKAYLYKYNKSEWEQIAAISGDANGDKYGTSVTLSGDGRWFGVGAASSDGMGYVDIFAVNN